MTGNIVSRGNRLAPTHQGEAGAHILGLSLRQPVRLAASLVRKLSVTTNGHLVYASSAAWVISSMKNYRGGVGGVLQMRGESAWAAREEMHTTVAGLARPRFMVQSLQTAIRALCCRLCKPWVETDLSGKHCFGPDKRNSTNYIVLTVQPENSVATLVQSNA